MRSLGVVLPGLLLLTGCSAPEPLSHMPLALVPPGGRAGPTEAIAGVPGARVVPEMLVPQDSGLPVDADEVRPAQRPLYEVWDGDAKYRVALIDDEDAIRGGEWYYVAGVGEAPPNRGRGMHWTPVSGTRQTAWVWWEHSGVPTVPPLEDKIYVSAFIPSRYATARAAYYDIHYRGYGSIYRRVCVDQSPIYDRYVFLGEYPARIRVGDGWSGRIYVTSGNDTGESRDSGRKLGIDVVKFAWKVTIAGQGGLPPELRAMLDRAHAQIGRRPIVDGEELGPGWCLRVVAWWAQRRTGKATAFEAWEYFQARGVTRVSASPFDAPTGAWVFYRYRAEPRGHVAVRCQHGLIHQEPSTGKVAHATDPYTRGGRAYLGYVAWGDVWAHTRPW